MYQSMAVTIAFPSRIIALSDISKVGCVSRSIDRLEFSPN